MPVFVNHMRRFCDGLHAGRPEEKAHGNVS
jgi:hypothetical protein